MAERSEFELSVYENPLRKPRGGSSEGGRVYNGGGRNQKGKRGHRNKSASFMLSMGSVRPTHLQVGPDAPSRITG
jgi:hypothetical protein